ncbi:Der GTPase-activating protein YihI [Arsukibacterium indicum]|uniref:Der GTPase-activating protein YihI n=1 Tax=Arsukibacterium indicum TaxID=2848612 RepID=A0ABS6MNL3_9GAMM|nr:Der GTPase-activating protein YihI [Arsukibacterium indicum]MBV2130388.1 GTPase-activating protein [Arsukibacterium indicum]
MTRQKKSRSAGNNGQRHMPATEARKLRQPKEETKKKGAGKKSGSRNAIVEHKAEQQAGHSGPKDPRTGSKKPIALVAEPPVAPQIKPDLLPKARLTKATVPGLSAAEELAMIENDAQLQQLLERVENNEVLTGKEAKYFNTKTARLEQLLEQLGLAGQADSAEDDDPLAQFERTDWRKSILGDED